MIYQPEMDFSEELESGFYLKKIYHFRTQLIVTVTVIITSLCKICYHYMFYFLLAISDREAVMIYQMEMTSWQNSNKKINKTTFERIYFLDLMLA